MPSLLRLAAIGAVAAAIASGCSRADSPAPSGRPTEIVRLDSAVASGHIDASLIPAVDSWLLATRSAAPADSAARDSMLLAERTAPYFAIFEADTRRLLPPLADASRALGGVDSLPQRVYGIVSPFAQSVVIVDTVVLVALNHYLGPGYEGYASFPAHTRVAKTPERIPLDVALAWNAVRYPFPDSIAAPTLLQRMAYEGALLALSLDATSTPDGPLALGWTPEMWADAVGHEDEAWKRLVGRELLFADDPALISRLTAPAPSSPDISPDAPGRMGLFLGLRMARANGAAPIDILTSRAYLNPDFLAPYARMRR